jgi:hypothetical protein
MEQTLARCLGVAIFCSVLVGSGRPASAAPITYSVTGTGGSAFVPQLGDSPILWVDSTGGASGAALAAVGFNPVIADPGGAVWGVDYGRGGSYALSSEFTMNAGEALNVDFSVFTRHASPWEDMGFALLLEDSAVVAVLGNVRPDAVLHYGSLGARPGSRFTSLSAGVSTSMTQTAVGNFELGSVQYGVVQDTGDCSGRCRTDVSSSYVPGAGTYQLLFGAYGSADNGKPMAIAVTSARVPEPGILALFGFGLAALRAFRPRR